MVAGHGAVSIITITSAGDGTTATTADSMTHGGMEAAGMAIMATMDGMATHTMATMVTTTITTTATTIATDITDMVTSAHATVAIWAKEQEEAVLLPIEYLHAATARCQDTDHLTTRNVQHAHTQEQKAARFVSRPTAQEEVMPTARLAAQDQATRQLAAQESAAQEATTTDAEQQQAQAAHVATTRA